MKLADASAGVCIRCNRLSPMGKTCERCRIHFSIHGVSVAGYYGDAVKELILRLKFHRDRSAARASAEMVLLRLDATKITFDVVTSVPISPQRYRERGYNQSELIAKELAKALKLPYSAFLGRANGDHQLGKDRKTRLEQAKLGFYVQKSVPHARILIIDDVVTTGATLDACARELRVAGAKQVWGAVVAKH
ncbi:MAG: ComF family protein [Candidatus Saccharibacteria bacterium]